MNDREKMQEEARKHKDFVFTPTQKRKGPTAQAGDPDELRRSMQEVAKGYPDAVLTPGEDGATQAGQFATSEDADNRGLDESEAYPDAGNESDQWQPQKVGMSFGRLNGFHVILLCLCVATVGVLCMNDNGFPTKSRPQPQPSPVAQQSTSADAVSQAAKADQEAWDQMRRDLARNYHNLQAQPTAPVAPASAEQTGEDLGNGEIRTALWALEHHTPEQLAKERFYIGGSYMSGSKFEELIQVMQSRGLLR